LPEVLGLRLPERWRQCDEQLVLLAAGRREQRFYAEPARHAFQRDLDADIGGGCQVRGVARQTVAQVDHRGRAVGGEPASRSDPWHRVREPQHHLGIRATACHQLVQRQPSAS
jgi:hypothetical protein